MNLQMKITESLQTTNEGDHVLDPFCGSMTTGKVSERLNRQFVGYGVQVY